MVKERKYSSYIPDNPTWKYFQTENKGISMIMYYSNGNKDEIFKLFLNTTLDYIEIKKQE
jgi:hypothetical protein